MHPVIQDFMDLMKEFRSRPDFVECHFYLKQIFDDYRDNCYKQAVANALYLPRDVMSRHVLIRFNQSLKTFMECPYLSQTAIELNAWRIVFQQRFGMKLAELYQKVKEDQVDICEKDFEIHIFNKPKEQPDDTY